MQDSLHAQCFWPLLAWARILIFSSWWQPGVSCNWSKSIKAQSFLIAIRKLHGVKANSIWECTRLLLCTHTQLLADAKALALINYLWGELRSEHKGINNCSFFVDFFFLTHQIRSRKLEISAAPTNAFRPPNEDPIIFNFEK